MMKKLFISFCLIAASLSSFSQTCEERENKLLEAMGGFSAGMLYNTYGFIGSVSDGFVHDAYNATTVNDLMEIQMKLADNMVKVMQDLVKGNMLTAQSDKDYAASVIMILNGLGAQAKFVVDYTKNKSKENQDSYEAQRKKNWKDISQLMGFKE